MPIFIDVDNFTGHDIAGLNFNHYLCVIKSSKRAKFFKIHATSKLIGKLFKLL